MEKVELKTLILDMQQAIPQWNFQNYVRIKSISWALMGSPMSPFSGVKIKFPEFQSSTLGDVSESTLVIPHSDGVSSSGSACVSIVCNTLEVLVDPTYVSGGIVLTYEDVVG